MRLKRLELQGYKTFASKAEFAFDSGITAIIGPNGSGKSNVADAVRWVLGEQSYRLLRGKRTEDMIFAGSAQRARAGLAQVTITLDNTEGWLPVEFSEVSITRRAYRSGENEYFLNGSQVRLREIGELLGRSGLARRTYTVIGQGLIDAALALRPEERRALFEEAAGITVHQSKRADALAKLDATQANLLRLADILSEIAPRLHTLKGQSERAERHAELTDQLQKLLRVWYGHQWYRAQDALEAARATLDKHTVAVEARRAEIAGLEGEIGAGRAEAASLRERLAGWHRESSRLHADADKVERDMAVWSERLRQLGQQAEDIASELAPLRTTAQSLQERIAAGEAGLAQLDAERTAQVAQAADAEREVQARERERQMVMSSLAKARDEAFRIATALADLRNRLVQLDERERELSAERADHGRQVAGCQVEIGEWERKIRAVRGELEAWVEATKVLEAQQKKALESAAQTAQGRPALESQLDTARGDLARLTGRRDLLGRLRDDMEGYYAGVRGAMHADIAGIIGPVAGLIKVAPELEKAMETALGSHLQDLVVERWEVAEEAIEHLKRSRAGRATFLPLDTLRPGEPLRAPRGEGIVGAAVDLVEYEARLQPAIDLLLGHTIVVDDLKVARRVQRELRGAYQLVTRGGEIVRSSGAVTGGTQRNDQEAGMLAREREWRELPAKIEAAQKVLAAAQMALEANRRTEAGHRQTAEDLRRDLGRRQTQQSELNTQLAELRRKQDRVSQQVEWHTHAMQGLDKELAALAGKRTDLAGELERRAPEQAAGEARVQSLSAQEAGLASDESRSRLNEVRQALAVLDSRRESQRQALRALRGNAQHTLDQISAKERRAGELAVGRAELSTQIEATGGGREGLLAELATYEAQIAPAEARLQEIEGRLTALYSAEEQQHARQRDAESRHSAASLEFQRREDALANLRKQINEDLGLVQVEAGDGVTDQAPLPLHPLVSDLFNVPVLPEGLEDEINRVRGQVRRLGSVNPAATEEYAAVLERHSFLGEQIADLEQASRSLRAVIAELDDIMERDFLQTFRAVSAQFKQFFATLFGGGSARLVLTDPNNIAATGIDILAQPPGKRQQGLALLSGGERALTAGALIFAILKVSPTPFCFLDEVDAALDEANVGRFRDCLRSLSDVTQFVLITHNRGTIETADTIYGITMGDDSTSRTLSLRLDGKDVE